MRARRWLLLLALVALLAPSCAPGFLEPSQVVALRILAVTIDKPYANPGDQVTMRMTVTDGNGALEGARQPRELSILWLSGCINPEGDQYFLCIEQLAETLAPFAQGGFPPEDVVKLDKATIDEDGVGDAHDFTFTVPNDIVSSRPKPDVGPHYGIEYIFFAACAGNIVPAPLTFSGGEVPDLPLDCISAEGEALGADGFVIGYTQLYVFADGRDNENPVTTGITLGGQPIASDVADAPTVNRCPVSFDDRRVAGCGSDSQALDDCDKYVLKVQVPADVAEVDPDGSDIEGEPIDETVWVSYFVEGGDVSTSTALVNDATTGLLDTFDTEWTPPAEPGLYRVWAVVRDQRGGSSVVQRSLNVQ
jgi:hypothetical protein